MLALSCLVLGTWEPALGEQITKKQQAAYDRCNHNGYVCVSKCDDIMGGDAMQKCLDKCNKKLKACTEKIRQTGMTGSPTNGSSGDAGVLESP